MDRQQFVFNIDELFEQFDMAQVLDKARKAHYRKVFQEEKYSTKNAGVIDGLEKPIDEVKHPVDWVIKD